MVNLDRAILTIAIVLLAVNSDAQTTIPERVARAGGSIDTGPSMPSGMAPSIHRIIEITDLIIRGIVGPPRSYMTPNQTEVLTDYRILKPTILYQSIPQLSQQPAVPEFTVTIRGGEVPVNAFTYSSIHPALPRLEPGMDAVFLLRYMNGKYVPSGIYYGVFDVTAVGLVPLTRKADFARELRGMVAQQAIDEIVRERLSLAGQQKK